MGVSIADIEQVNVSWEFPLIETIFFVHRKHFKLEIVSLNKKFSFLNFIVVPKKLLPKIFHLISTDTELVC